MEEIIEEYGLVIVGAIATVMVLAVLTKLIFSGGILGNLLMKLGNMSC